VRSAPDRLFVVTGSLQVGGTENHLLRVLPELAGRGWRVTVFALSGDGPLRAPLQHVGVVVRFTPHVGKLLAHKILVLRLLRLAIVSVHLTWLLRAERPAVAHFFLPEAYLAGGLCALAAGVPAKVMSRRSSNLYQQRQPGIARVERWLHRRMSRITGNSQAVIRELEQEGIPPSRLQLIYNGIDLPPPPDAAARAATRAALGLETDSLVLITVANLIPYKGHLDLLEALALAGDALPAGWRLLCAGRDEGYGAVLRRRAEHLGLQDRVLWLGGRRDIPDLLGAADIGVLASHEEGFSNAILEGMGAGLPIIATDVGGNAEAVLDGITGYVVPRQQPDALATAIRRLAADAGLRRRLGMAGRNRVATQFTLSQCVGRYEDLYGRLGAGPVHFQAADRASGHNDDPDLSNTLEAADVQHRRIH
jgi:glycosyltransferase involved in cell wall biosynthesis